MLNSAKAKTAIAVAALIAIVIGALGWFFLILPKFEEASDIEEQAAALEDRNAIELVRIGELKARFDRIDEIRDEIVGYQVGIPSDGENDAFSDFVVSKAAEQELHIFAFGFSPATAVEADSKPALPPTLQAEREAAEAASAAAASEAAKDDDTESSPEPIAAPVLIEGFYAIQNEVTVIGPKDNALRFLEAIQAQSTRHNLVFEYTLLSLGEAAASGGRPETVVGDVELTIKGLIYVLQDPYGVIEKAPAEKIAPPVAGERNPFVPLPENLSNVGSTGSGDTED